jgi:NitT/TauT family transport system substrate-binding protein
MPNSKRNPKREFLRASGAAALVGLYLGLPVQLHAQSGSTQQLRSVTMILDWLYTGPNIGFVVAKDKGFYERAGLDVNVTMGKGSGSTAQLVANKVGQFGFSDGYVVANSIASGMSLKMVASIYRRNPTAVHVLYDSPIKSPKDLEGRSLGINAGGTQFQQFPAFAKGCGVDPAKVRLVNMDPTGIAPALITGKVDAVAGYAQGTAPGIEIRGNKKLRLLWYADCGVTAVSNGIIAHPDFIQENPTLVRDFVNASLRGFLYARQNVEEAIAINRKFNAAASDAVTRREFELSWASWVTPNTAGRPLGWMSDKDWAETARVLREYGGVKTPIDIKHVYTNEFVPTGAEFVPPQPKS